jgi:hypothetical protein
VHYLALRVKRSIINVVFFNRRTKEHRAQATLKKDNKNNQITCLTTGARYNDTSFFSIQAIIPFIDTFCSKKSNLASARIICFP